MKKVHAYCGEDRSEKSVNLFLCLVASSNKLGVLHVNVKSCRIAKNNKEKSKENKERWLQSGWKCSLGV